MNDQPTATSEAAQKSFAGIGDRAVRVKGIAQSTGYIANLDGIRGIAVLLVLASHSFGLFGGMLGVDVFFVLSGFLITNLLLAERASNVSLAVFYWRRFLRLMPALAVVSAAVFLAFPYLPGTSSRSCEVLAPMLGVANWTTPFGADCPRYMGHAWSLSIEEQFYLMWPVLLIAALRLGGRRAALVMAIVLAGASGLWRAYLALNQAPITRIYWPFDTRCDGLLVGAAAALAQYGAGAGAGAGRFYRAARALWAPAAVALVCVVALAKSHMPFFEGGYTAIAVLSMIVIVAASRTEAGVLDRLFGVKPLVYLGTLSYGFYLWHYPVAVWAMSWPASGAEKFVAIGAISFCAAYGSKRLIELPVLQLRPAATQRPWLGWAALCISITSVALGVFLYLPQ